MDKIGKFSFICLFFLVFMSSQTLLAQDKEGGLSNIINIYKQVFKPKEIEKTSKSISTYKRREIIKPKEENKTEEEILKLNSPEFIHLGKKDKEENVDNVSLETEEKNRNFEYIKDLTAFKDIYAVFSDKERPKYDVVAIQEGRNFATINNTIYINPHIRKSNASIFKRSEKLLLFIPVNRLSLKATLYKAAGVCEIQDIITSNKYSNNVVLIARVLEAYEPIEPGFKAEKYDPPKIKTIVDNKDYVSNINGKILLLSGENRFIGAGYQCITNLGEKDKVKLGDVLDIIRIKSGPGFRLPIKLGEAQIIHVNENYSTAYILTANIEITEGDLVTLSKVAVY